MKYKYLIAGRLPGNPRATMYRGRLTADTPKQAIIKALAQEFGDIDKSRDPIERLTRLGWIDKETLMDQWGPLDVDETNFELDTGEHTFDVEVTEIG